MPELLSSYWWEFKNCNIKAYVNSCDTCAKCKGNYGKRARWPIGYCKEGKGPFDLVFIDFVTMLNSKGKRYTLTILDSFSQHFTAILCARDRTIDAARRLYQCFFSPQRNTSHIRSRHTLYFAAKCPLFQNFTVPGDCKAREILSSSITRWRMPSTCYARTETVNGQTSLNPSPHPSMLRLTVLQVHLHITPSLVATPV